MNSEEGDLDACAEAESPPFFGCGAFHLVEALDQQRRQFEDEALDQSLVKHAGSWLCSTQLSCNPHGTRQLSLHPFMVDVSNIK